MTNQHAAQLLTEMAELRRRARAHRHAYWLPLGVFGLLILGSAPVYVSVGWNLSLSPLPAAYWLIAVVIGCAVTLWWYARHGEATGIRTATRGAALAWVITAVMLLLAGLPLVGVLLSPLGWLNFRGLGGLFAIAVGLVTLARVERSRLLWAVTAAFAAVTAVALLYNPENLLFDLLSAFGVPDQDMPYTAARATAPALAACVLLIGSLLALVARSRTRRIASKR